MAKQSWQRWIPLIAGTVIVLLVAVGLSLFVFHLMRNKPKSDSRQVAQIVNIIRPPPPPDTPPPPPPPPEEKIEQPVEQPQQTPEQAPQQALGIDADASAGGDSFGLQARPGGRDLVGTGTAPFAWYTSKIQDLIQQRLSDDDRVRKGSYQISVKVWLTRDGYIERAKVVGTSGNSDRDNAIEAALSQRIDVGASPPVEMPQPITLRIVLRG